MIETHIKNEEARRLIDNKIWTRDELRKPRGKAAEKRQDHFQYPQTSSQTLASKTN